MYGNRQTSMGHSSLIKRGSSVKSTRLRIESMESGGRLLVHIVYIFFSVSQFYTCKPAAIKLLPRYLVTLL